MKSKTFRTREVEKIMIDIKNLTQRMREKKPMSIGKMLEGINLM